MALPRRVPHILIREEGADMKCCKNSVSPTTVAALAFALGILLSKVLPPAALAVLLAVLILAAGILALLRK